MTPPRTKGSCGEDRGRDRRHPAGQSGRRDHPAHAADITLQSRYGSGVRVMRLGEGDKVMVLARTEHDEAQAETVEQDADAAKSRLPEELAAMRLRTKPPLQNPPPRTQRNKSTNSKREKRNPRAFKGPWGFCRTNPLCQSLSPLGRWSTPKGRKTEGWIPGRTLSVSLRSPALPEG